MCACVCAQVRALVAVYGLEARACGRTGQTLFKTERTGPLTRESCAQVCHGHTSSCPCFSKAERGASRLPPWLYKDLGAQQVGFRRRACFRKDFHIAWASVLGSQVGTSKGVNSQRCGGFLPRVLSKCESWWCRYSSSGSVSEPG